MLGVIKWFDINKGFGVIKNPNEIEYFIHTTEILDFHVDIKEGTVVIFKEQTNSISDKKSAKKCRTNLYTEDWKELMYYLDSHSSVTIEIKVIKRGHRGNPYKAIEFKTFNILQEGIQNIILNNDIEDIFNMITDYYEENLHTNLFISYCKLIESSLNINIHDSIIAEKLLNRIFNHFGVFINHEILFACWKSHNFRYIGYVDALDFQIPENIFLQNVEELGINEFERIFKYGFNSDFVFNLLETKIEKSINLDVDNYNSLYKILDIPFEKELNAQKLKLDQIVFKKIKEKINKVSLKYNLIPDFEILNEFTSIKKELPANLNDEFKTEIILELEKLIINKSSSDFLIELWISDITASKPNLNDSIKYFINPEITNNKRIKFLLKSPFEFQLELLKQYLNLYMREKAYELLKLYIKSINNLTGDIEYASYFTSNKQWIKKKQHEIIKTFNLYVLENCNDIEKLELFFIGYIDEIPLKLVLEKLDSFNIDQFKEICTTKKFKQNELIQIFNTWLTLKSMQNIELILTLAKSVLNKVNFKKVDEKILKEISEISHFNLWETGLSDIFPEKYIISHLNHQAENFKSLQNWINKGLVSKDFICNLLSNNLESLHSIDSRPIFQTVINQIQWISINDSSYLTNIIKSENKYYNLILWFLNKSELFDFEFLKEKFILFSPSQEVLIIKKLFFLKAENKFDLTVYKLDSLFRIDFDLYNLGKENDNSVDIDISSDILIKSIISYSNQNKFLSEKDLLDIVLRNFKFNKNKRFKIAHYFEECQGRAKYEFDYKSSENGVIFKKFYNENQDFYFAIRNNYSNNSEFANIKDTIKMLPSAKWNPQEKHWGIHSKYESEVYDFGRKNNFKINTDASNIKSNNLHFAKIVRYEIPDGISFCEGRLANKVDKYYKVPFWWCAGNVCYNHCETIHEKNEWENYTLIDFAAILGFDLDEINHMGDFIPKGQYYKFTGLINRFNKLLNHLYCHECDEILYPIQTSHFAANNYTTFGCENLSCSIHKKPIYLNRCVTNSCENIIDDRISKRCPNGLVICDKCSSCCSHYNMKKRYENLKLVGGYIHPEFIQKIRNKKGHRERGKHFCYNCSNLMYEKENEIFHCENCRKDFDLRKYNFDRTNKNDEQGELEEDTFFNDFDDLSI